MARVFGLNEAYRKWRLSKLKLEDFSSSVNKHKLLGGGGGGEIINIVCTTAFDPNMFYTEIN